MTQDEMEMHIKELENIVITLITKLQYTKFPFIDGICFNTSLHHNHLFVEDEIEHPIDLELPHYTFKPPVYWGGSIINIHPANLKRMQDMRK